MLRITFILAFVFLYKLSFPQMNEGFPKNISKEKLEESGIRKIVIKEKSEKSSDDFNRMKSRKYYYSKNKILKKIKAKQIIQNGKTVNIYVRIKYENEKKYSEEYRGFIFGLFPKEYMSGQTKYFYRNDTLIEIHYIKREKEINDNTLVNIKYYENTVTEFEYSFDSFKNESDSNWVVKRRYTFWKDDLLKEYYESGKSYLDITTFSYDTFNNSFTKESEFIILENGIEVQKISTFFECDCIDNFLPLTCKDKTRNILRKFMYNQDGLLIREEIIEDGKVKFVRKYKYKK